MCFALTICSLQSLVVFALTCALTLTYRVSEAHAQEFPTARALTNSASEVSSTPANRDSLPKDQLVIVGYGCYTNSPETTALEGEKTVFLVTTLSERRFAVSGPGLKQWETVTNVPSYLSPANREKLSFAVPNASILFTTLAALNSPTFDQLVIRAINNSLRAANDGQLPESRTIALNSATKTAQYNGVNGSPYDLRRHVRDNMFAPQGETYPAAEEAQMKATPLGSKADDNGKTESGTEASAQVIKANADHSVRDEPIATTVEQARLVGPIQGGESQHETASTAPDAIQVTNSDNTLAGLTSRRSGKLAIAACLLIAVALFVHVRLVRRRHTRFVDGLTPDSERDLIELLRFGAVSIGASGRDITRIVIEVRNCLEKPLKLRIDPGTCFSSQGAHQDMVAVETTNLCLIPGGAITVPISAACVNASRPIPKETDGFRRVYPASKLLNRFLRAATRSSPMARQAGVWAITDGYNAGQCQNHLLRRTRDGDSVSAITDDDIDEARRLLRSINSPRRL